MNAAIKACDKLLSDTGISQGLRASAFRNRAVRLMAVGRLDEAISDFNNDIALAAKDAVGLAMRGILFAKLGKINNARSDLDQSLRINPDLPQAYTARGLLNYQTGDLDASIDDSTRAIALDSRQGAAYNNRGSAFRDKGQYKLAIADFNVVVRLNPESARPLYNRGLTYQRMGNQAQALRDFEAALVLSPGDPDALAGRDKMRAALDRSGLGDHTRTEEVVIDTPDAAARCEELFFFLGSPKSFFKSGEKLHVGNKEIPVADLTDKDYELLNEPLKDCKKYNRKGFERGSIFNAQNIIESSKAEIIQTEKSRKIEAQMKEDATIKEEMRHMDRDNLSDADLKRLEEIASTHPFLAFDAQRIIDNYNYKVGMQRAAERQEREAQQKAEAEKVQKQKAAEFFKNLSPTCQAAIQAEKDLRNSDITDRLARANILAQAGESAAACMQLDEVNRQAEAGRTAYVACSREMSAKTDAMSQSLALATLQAAAPLHQAEENISQAKQEFKCD